MPELPDVKVLRQYLDATSLHQEIQEVQVHSDRILKELTLPGRSRDFHIAQPAGYEHAVRKPRLLW